MIKPSKIDQILDPETFFYDIPLEKPNLRLSREELDMHYSAKVKKIFRGSRCDYIGYAHGILSVEVFLNEQMRHKLFLHVGEDNLHITCSCGMPGERLCIHAYIGLHDMVWRDYFDFERFYWPGYESDEKLQQKFLNVEVDKRRIFVEPKFRYGNIFRPGLVFLDNRHISLKVQPDVFQGIDWSREEVIAFCLCYSVGGYFNAHLPIIVPCLAKTGKDGKSVTSILQFSTAKKPVTKIEFTANQLLLKDISLRQYELAKNWDKSSQDESGLELATLKDALFALWQEALPLLIREKYCCTYYLYWLKFLDQKPRTKKYLQSCQFSLDKPVLSFVLKFYADHFSLFAEVHVNGQHLKTEGWGAKPPLVLFDEKHGLCYLMQSVQDDDLFWWMLNNNGRLTVLKEHFIEFHHTFLDQLSRCYPISFIKKPGTKNKYSFDDVLQETSLLKPDLP